MSVNILIVDDEPHIREVIRFALEQDGKTTIIARNGVEALASLRRSPIQLVILDIGMPEMDGLEACRRIRKFSNVPILFLSARGEEIDRILGLEIGGDDYVTKPFSPRELVTRVNVILRRAQQGNGAKSPTKEVLSYGPICLDVARHQVTYDDKLIELTNTEFAILHALMLHPEMVLGREQLMRSAYPQNIHVSERTIDSHVRNLRSKFAKLGCAKVIRTIHGVGFVLANISIIEAME